MAIVSSNVASKVSQNLQNLIDAETSEILASQSAAQKIQDSNKTAVIGPIVIELNPEQLASPEGPIKLEKGDSNFIDSSDDGTGTKSSIYFETEGNSGSELGDKSIRTEEMKQLTLEEIIQTRVVDESETQKQKEKRARLIAEQEESRTKTEAIQASRLEKKKQWAK